jgi:hypothetical protein
VDVTICTLPRASEEDPLQTYVVATLVGQDGRPEPFGVPDTSNIRCARADC